MKGRELQSAIAILKDIGIDPKKMTPDIVKKLEDESEDPSSVLKSLGINKSRLSDPDEGPRILEKMQLWLNKYNRKPTEHKKKIPPNSKCTCGSNKKYKHCHGNPAISSNSILPGQT